jgi:phage baseplate assembly protein gpV
MAAYDDIVKHMSKCKDPKGVRDRRGVCFDDGAVVNYEQVTCTHAMHVVGSCPECKRNYDRAGWLGTKEA